MELLILFLGPYLLSVCVICFLLVMRASYLFGGTGTEVPLVQCLTTVSTAGKLYTIGDNPMKRSLKGSTKSPERSTSYGQSARR